MAIPLTSQEAEKAGLKKASGAMMTPLQSLSGGLYFTPAQVSYICYVGPCSDGTRTICYRTESGCDNCYVTSEGC
jgi:hypothetical protein